MEFKLRVPTPERIAKEVTAFANTSGGQLLIGVQDNGTAKGVKDAAEEEFALKEALGQCVDPPITMQTTRVRVSRKRAIILVDVPDSPEKPHYVIDPATTNRLAYIRVEDKSVVASKEARRLMRFQHSDKNLLIRIGKQERALLRHLEKHDRITVREFSRMVGIPRHWASHKVVLLTRARILRHHPGIGEDHFSLGPELLGDEKASSSDSTFPSALSPMHIH